MEYEILEATDLAGAQLVVEPPPPPKAPKAPKPPTFDTVPNTIYNVGVLLALSDIDSKASHSRFK